MKTDSYPKLRAYLRGLNTIEQEEFARRCGTTLNYLRKAMSKQSKMDVKLVELLVINSNFIVPPRELRPDVEWEVFADAAVINAISSVSRRRRSAVCAVAAA